MILLVLCTSLAAQLVVCIMLAVALSVLALIIRRHAVEDSREGEMVAKADFHWHFAF